MEIFLDALLDALIDGVKMLPFLYLAYLLIEWLERHHGENIESALAGGGRWGFLPGALLGCVPQCGFSAVASNFYASRVITPGTLLAVFIATSDEAIPLLAAEPSQWTTLVLLIVCKIIFAIVGGVLLDFSAELFSRRLHVGAEGEALLRQHLLCTTDWVRLDRGTITEEEVYAHACARLPAELHAAAEYIIYHWNEPIVPITGTADVVRELKARGYTLYLLSNAARRQHTYWHDIPSSECFSGTLISADVHLLKPEAAIYQALFDKFDLTAASCLFVDDFPPNIEAAENAGMQGIVFHDAGQLREELKARGIL